MESATVNSINVADPQTWDGNVFLTFDVDWAPDGVLEDTINLVEAAGTKATWLLTHDTPLVARLRENPDFELGIHPNFNAMLQRKDGSARRTAEQTIGELMRIVPEAVTVRSHSMFQSSRLLDVFRNAGLLYDCNTFVPRSSEVTLRPWQHWNGLVKVPYFWEDDVHAIDMDNGSSAGWDVEPFLAHPGLRVFDFHPVHVALNTEGMARYESAREHHANADRVNERRCTDEHRGTRVFLKRLLDRIAT